MVMGNEQVADWLVQKLGPRWIRLPVVDFGAVITNADRDIWIWVHEGRLVVESGDYVRFARTILNVADPHVIARLRKLIREQEHG